MLSWGTFMKPDNDIERELRHHYLLSALTDLQRARVLDKAQLREFAAGERLFAHGDPAAHFFLLRKGTVKLYRLSPGGHEKIMPVAR